MVDEGRVTRLLRSLDERTARLNDAKAEGDRSPLLVHRYVEVDDTIVIAALDRLEEFERFVTEVSAWLLAHGS